MKKIVYILTIILVFSFEKSQAQVLPNLGGQRAGLATFSFLKNDMNPRSAALGGASVAINSAGYATFSNPAFAADLKGINTTFSNYLVGAGVYQGYLSVVYPDANNVAAYGLSVNFLTSGAMEVRTEFQPDGTGQEIQASTVGVGFTYSKRLSDM